MNAILNLRYHLDGVYSNDIGIIKVKTHSSFGIVFNTHVRPICLPSPGDTPAPGAMCTVTGWGLQTGDYIRNTIEFSPTYLNYRIILPLLVQLKTQKALPTN